MYKKIRHTYGVLNYYIKKGKGVPILFLHGAGSNHTVWKPIFLHLQNPIIAIDLRGHGLSTVEFHNFEESIQDIFDVMSAEKIRKAVLCGLSVGCVVCHAFAEKYPHKVSKLVLVSPFAANTTRCTQMVGFLARHYHRFRKHLGLTRTRVFQDYGTISKKPSAWSPYLDVSGCSTTTISTCVDAIVRKKFLFHKVRIPTLVLFGRTDLFFKIREILHTSRHVIVRMLESDHLLLQHQPEIVHQLIKKFIRGDTV